MVCRVPLQAVPVTACAQEEGRGKLVGVAVWNLEAGAVTSGAGFCFSEVISPVYFHHVKSNSIHHSEPGLSTSTFQCWPFKIIKHGCDATSPVVVASDIPSTIALYLLINQ